MNSQTCPKKCKKSPECCKKTCCVKKKNEQNYTVVKILKKIFETWFSCIKYSFIQFRSVISVGFFLSAIMISILCLFGADENAIYNTTLNIWSGIFIGIWLVLTFKKDKLEKLSYFTVSAATIIIFTIVISAISAQISVPWLTYSVYALYILIFMTIGVLCLNALFKKIKKFLEKYFLEKNNTAMSTAKSILINFTAFVTAIGSLFAAILPLIRMLSDILRNK